MASGLPPVSATMRSATSASMGRPTVLASRSYASCFGRPASRRAGNACRRGSGSRGLPDREQHPDPVGQQPAGHEAEDLGGLVVQPLRVVDHAQHRPVPGRVREQREHGQADQERIGGRPAHQSERHAQRLPLRPGQPVHAVQKGKEQLMDGGEAQARLRLDRHHPDDLQVRGVLRLRSRAAQTSPHRAHPEGPARRSCQLRTLSSSSSQRLLLRAAVHQPHPTTVALIALV